jgi:hypothetical protein
MVHLLVQYANGALVRRDGDVWVYGFGVLVAAAVTDEAWMFVGRDTDRAFEHLGRVAGLFTDVALPAAGCHD